MRNRLLISGMDSDGHKIHAPFAELFPCAIDKKARELAKDADEVYQVFCGLARRIK